MNEKQNSEQTDADNPEWTPEDFDNAVPFPDLPKSLQFKLHGVVDARQSASAGCAPRGYNAMREWLKQRSV